MMIAVPVVIALAFAVSPHATRERLVSLVQPRENVDSNEHRVVTFRTGLEMIKAHPVFGIGPEEIARNFEHYVPPDIPHPLPVGYYGHLHNIYIQYAAERGLPGLACILWFIGLTLYDCARGILAMRRASISRSDELFVLHGAVAVIIGVLVGGLFEYNLGDSEVLMMFVAVVGLAYSALEQARYRELSPALTPSAETVSK
jgi:O-antigen ligase